MSITMKPKKVREAEVKPKVLTRPPGEIIDHLRNSPITSQAAAADRKPFFPLAYKQVLLATLRQPDYDWLLSSLRPDVMDVNAKMLRDRIDSLSIACDGFIAVGKPDGIHAITEGDDVGTWSYADLAAEAIATKPQKGKRGKKTPDAETKTAESGTLARPNVHGVVETGAERIRIPLPAASKCEAEIYLAMLPDGWRYGLNVRRPQGGHSFGPNVKDTAHASREIALQIAAVRARDFFVDAHKRSDSQPTEADRCHKAAIAAQAFIDSLTPSEPAVAAPQPAPQAPDAGDAVTDLFTGRMIDLKLLDRHPENRDIDEAEVKGLAESLKADKQLESLVIREIPGGRWQIISGERRSKAAKLNDWKQVRCDGIRCDDATASFLVGLYNGQRKDLTPIEKARQIEFMCKRGKTREEAARAVGLESGSAASNLVRLLKLPKQWQERISSGDLPESFARIISGYAQVPLLMEELNDAWENTWDYGETYSSRNALEEAIQIRLDDCTRPIDTVLVRTHRYDDYNGKFQSGDYKCLLTPAEIAEHREQLGIVTVNVKEKKGKSGKWESVGEVEVATNVKLYDELQIPHIVALQVEKGKAKAKKAGAAADAGEKVKPKTPAEIKQAKEDRARQLERAIGDWVDTVLRRDTAAAMRAFKPTPKVDLRLLKLVLAFMADVGGFNRLLNVQDAGRAFGIKTNGTDEPYTVISRALSQASKDTLCKGCEVSRWQTAAAEICAGLIGGDAEGRGSQQIDEEVLLALYTEWGGSLAVSWERLYRAKDPLIAEFFENHRKDELAALANELKLGYTAMQLADSTKSHLVEKLTTMRNPPALPKSLQPAKKRGSK